MDISVYDHIISDWISGRNLQEGLNRVYSDSKIINDEVIRLLSKPDNEISLKDIDNMLCILKLSNILYNNTSNNMLVLEDGVYDLLISKYKNITGKEVIGAVPINFDCIQDTGKKLQKDLIPGVIYNTEQENNYIDNKMLFYSDLNRVKSLTKNDMLIPGVNYERIVTKRLRDTAHNNPELVGTLDKCKFVLVSQAKDKGVDIEDPTVKILERDFFGKHIEKGIINYNDNIDIIAELKYDGVSIELEVFNQRVISAITRGDTELDVATDITPILEGYYFPDCPPLDHPIGLKVEAIMTYDNLERYSALKGRKFANGRTAIISWISSADAYQYKELVTLIPLATNIMENGHHLDRLIEVEFMNRYLCRGELLRYSIISGNLTSVLFQIYRFAEEAEFMRKFLPFMYDGIVVSYLDQEKRELLGRKDSVNQYSVAVKFNSLVRETVFTGYRYTIGQNGEITPMIYFNPVEFFGTIHPKSSGHSYGRFKELSLRLGDIIEVEYRNDVITYVTKKDCIENENNQFPIIEFPAICPFCGSQLVFTESSARCPNFYCTERSIKRMSNMMAKLQFTGFAEETVRALNVDSFYKLMQLKLDDISHIGELTSQSLISQLDNLRNGNLYEWRLIGALGFTDLASNTWKLIFKNITLRDFHNLMKTYYDCGDNGVITMLLNIKGIGKASVDTILNEYIYFIPDIEYILSFVKFRDSINDKSIKVRFTGVRNKELVDALNNMGYDAGEGSVTKDTDILIVPSEGYNSGSKYNKAIMYGITIKPIQTFIQELGLDIK